MKTIGLMMIPCAALLAQDTTLQQKKIRDEVQFRILSTMTAASNVKGAPYSAVSVNETVQVLADGNRIVQTTTTAHYRDSMGRERTDNNVGADGTAMSIHISDPVEGVQYTLLPADKSGAKSFLPYRMTDKAAMEAKIKAETRAKLLEEGAGAILRAPVDTVMMPGGSGSGSGVGAMVAPFLTEATGVPLGAKNSVEDLGTRIIEGVTATGTRRTTTIPASSVGNERDIVIVAERWYSDELHALVLNTRTDPRTGTMTYKLTNIIRGEQPLTLFQAPADYTIKDVTRAVVKKDDER